MHVSTSQGRYVESTGCGDACEYSAGEHGMRDWFVVRLHV